MPEGHTVHRMARDHTEWFSDQSVVVLSPQGRFAKEARRLNGKSFQRAEAYGKHLFYFWSGQNITHIHLGLYGKFHLHENPAGQPKGAVRLRMIGDSRTLDLNGPNQCRLITATGYRAVVDRLGQDPLRPDADPDMVWQRICRSRAAIGSLLLNQSIIAGIGNVYRAEILFLMGICPDRPACELTRDEFDRIWKLCVDLLILGMKHNRIVTVDQETLRKPLHQATIRERTWIYKSPECPKCGNDIYYWELGARTIYSCQSCQPG